MTNDIDIQRKISLFIPTMGGGGAERVTINLARGFLDAGHVVELVLVTGGGPLMDEIPGGVQVVDLGKKRALGATAAFLKYVRESRPDVVVSSLARANLLTVLACLQPGVSTKSLITIHNTYSSFSKDWKWRVSTWLSKKMYRRADAIVAVSNGVADDLARYIAIGRDSIDVIYNPILTPEVLARIEKARQTGSVAEGDKIIVGVGRLARQKNFASLVRAFGQLREKRDDVGLVVFGEGPDRPELEQLVNDLDLDRFVDMPGFVPDIIEQLVRADLFVLSSLHEGLPTVIIEALAAGCKIVSTDCPSGPRELLEDGRLGTLVEVGDDEALAKAMDAALSKVSTMTNVVDVEQFTVPVVSESYLKVIDRI